MTNDEAAAIRAEAAKLQASIEADILNAMTRIEHIRLTQLAEQAQHLLDEIDKTRPTVLN